MKLCIGNTYEEAIATRPMTGVKQDDIAGLRTIFMRHKVVLNYKPVQRNCRYTWKRGGPFCFYVVDNTYADKPLVMRGDGSGKPIVFKSIYKAMIWIYNNDKDYYDSLPNLSARKEGEVPKASAVEHVPVDIENLPF